MEISPCNSPRIAVDPCASFNEWAVNSDSRIRAAGIALRRRWCREALAHAQTQPLIGFITRCVRENVPGAPVALQDAAELSVYLTKLERRIAALEGGEL